MPRNITETNQRLISTDLSVNSDGNMKATSHFMVGVIAYVITIIFFPQVNLPALFWICFLCATILPDSDSSDEGSKIYYTRLKIFAIMTHRIEPFIAKILGRDVTHRGSLHTVFGILITSLIVSIPVSLLFGMDNLVIIYLGIFFGQILHIMCDIDLQRRWYPSLR